MAANTYECKFCGTKFDSRSLVIEVHDPVMIRRAKDKGKSFSMGDFICHKCSQEMYKGETSPRKLTANCPKCGEVIEVWF